MEYIRDHIESANTFGDYYANNVYEHLKITINEITGKFVEIFEKFAREYQLVISNSVYSEIYLFEFTNRVKEPISLIEKLKNKNLIFELKQSFDLSSTLDQDQMESLNNFFYKIDDILGIKILTSLNEDCKNVIKLISDHVKELPDLELDINGDIPTTMNNGRKIYKLKGCYKSTYSFELQVKSKIDSTWGDLEHNLFYKDYDFNYVKNNNKEIMSGVGSLLEKTEDLMLSIRQSKEEFNNDYTRYRFYQLINEDFEHFIEDLYGSKFILEKNMDGLYHLYNYCFERNSEVNRVADIKIPQQLSLNNPLSNNFNVLKLKNLDIALFEAIHYNWLLQIRPEEEIEEKDRLENLIAGLLHYSFNQIGNSFNMTLLSETYTSNIINILKENSFNHFKGNILLDINILAQFVMIYSSVENIVDNSKDEEFIEFDDLNIDNHQEFTIELMLILFKSLIVEEMVVIDEQDKRIFISKMITYLNINHLDSSNKKKFHVIQETISSLNAILGGGYNE